MNEFACIIIIIAFFCIGPYIFFSVFEKAQEKAEDKGCGGQFILIVFLLLQFRR